MLMKDSRQRLLYDSIDIKFKKRLNQSLVIEVRKYLVAGAHERTFYGMEVLCVLFWEWIPEHYH